MIRKLWVLLAIVAGILSPAQAQDDVVFPEDLFARPGETQAGKGGVGDFFVSKYYYVRDNHRTVTRWLEWFNLYPAYQIRSFNQDQRIVSSLNQVYDTKFKNTRGPQLSFAADIRLLPFIYATGAFSPKVRFEGTSETRPSTYVLRWVYTTQTLSTEGYHYGLNLKFPEKKPFYITAGGGLQVMKFNHTTLLYLPQGGSFSLSYNQEKKNLRGLYFSVRTGFRPIRPVSIYLQFEGARTPNLTIKEQQLFENTTQLKRTFAGYRIKTASFAISTGIGFHPFGEY